MADIIDQTPTPCQYVIHLDTFDSYEEYNSYVEVRNGKNWRALGPQRGHLGNHSKSAAEYRAEKETKKARKAALRKGFKLLDVARNFAPKKHQIRYCMRNPGLGKDGKPLESVGLEVKGGRGRWAQVATCKSVSACPICAPRIMSKKAREVMIAASEHRKTGGCTALITLTTRHKRNNDLDAEMKKWAKSLSEMKAHDGYKAIWREYGVIGSIRALENPHGVNGWHLHTHDAWFFEGKITKKQAKDIELRLFKLWHKYCEKNDLGLPTKAHGVRVDYRESDKPEDDAIGSYITKMGSELTGAVHKRGKTGSRTYWQMLDDLSEKWDLKTSRLVREHMKAMKGRALLYWSRGLKARFNVDEIYETEESERHEKEGGVTERLEVKTPTFYAIVRANKRAECQEIIEDEGVDAASAYVDDIYQRDLREIKRIEAEKRAVRKEIERSTLEHMQDIGIYARI